MTLALPLRVSFCRMLGAALLCGAVLSARAQNPDSVAPEIVSSDGVPAVQVGLDAGPGGLLLPTPDALLNPGEGTVAARFNMAAFPSNGIVLDFGGGPAGRMAILEAYANGDSRHGHFRLVVGDVSARKIIEAPDGDAGHLYNLAFAWHDGICTFWLDGKTIGTLPTGPPWKGTPDRLALVEELGVQWAQVEIWSKALSEDRIQALTNADPWTLDQDATFLARKGEMKGAAQIGWVGPGLMAPEKVVAELEAPVVAKEYFVDAAKGQADGDGSADHPFSTIAAAAVVAGPGDTVTVLPGIYRESIVLTRSGRKGAPITFRASTDGPVTLCGTDPITGFQSGGSNAVASLWVKTGFNSRDTGFGDASYRARLTAQGDNGLRQIERRGRIDTFWSDGRLLPKAESPGQLTPYSFWVDKDKKELILALSPDDRADNHRLEVGARGAFFQGNVSYVVLRGFRAVGADTSDFIGTIDMGLSSSNWIVEDIDESGGNWAGIILRGWGHKLLHNVTDDNGDEGIAGSLSQYTLLDGNTCRFNNWQRGINPAFEAAGSKFTQVNYMTVRHQLGAYNLGPGLWYDCNNSNVTVEDSCFHHNGGGIVTEISPGPFLFRNNLCYSNEGSGIGAAESFNVRIENNTLVGNQYGVGLRNLRNRLGPGLTTPGSTYKVQNIEIEHNILADNWGAGLACTYSPVDVVQDKITSDHNVFFRNGSAAVWMLKPGTASSAQVNAANDWIPPEEGGGTKLHNLADVQKVLGLDLNSVTADPKFRMSGVYEYQSGAFGSNATLQAGFDFTDASPPSATDAPH